MRNLHFCLLLLGCMSVVQAQTNRQSVLKGRVMDELERPIVYAGVSIVHTAYYTTTDSAGYFAFEWANLDSCTLRVSHMAYEPVVLQLKKPFNELTVRLRTKQQFLEEVIVSTGYQQTPKERATGSFEQVDQTLFNRQIGTDVISRLDGLVPGVLFNKRGGATQDFQIRGLSTMYGDERPLIVLDNFPYEGDLNNINPNDIESITFLKDAAASSIWGARAGNGVLVVNTKKGGYAQPLRLSFNSNMTLREKPDLFYQPQMQVRDFMEVERFLFERGAFNSLLANNTTRPVITPFVELLNDWRDGVIAETELNNAIAAFQERDIRGDYDRYFYRKGIDQQYALSVSGGDPRLHYRLSGGFDKNLSNLRENDLSRLTLNSQNTFKPIDALEFTLGLTYTASRQQQNNPGLVMPGLSGAIYPYARLVDDDGNAAVLEQNYRLRYVQGVGDGKLLDWLYRPLDEIYLADNTTRLNDWLINVGTRYSLFPWLSASVKYQFERQESTARNYRSQDLFFTRDLINRYSVIQGDQVMRNIPLGGILDLQRVSMRAHQVRGQLDVNKRFGAKHLLDAIVGSEIRQRELLTDQNRVYGYNDGLLTVGSVDYRNLYPIFDGLGFNNLIPNNLAFTGILDRFVSLYANAAYTYDNRYVLSLSARRDASNLFGTATNDKWKPLWSAGAKWNVSLEDFYSNDLLPRLALRATYGYSGNVNRSVPAVTTLTFSTSPSYYAQQPYAFVVNPPNSNLKWENVGQLNLGLDFGFKDNRVYGSLEYYRKKSTDLLTSVPVDWTIGFQSLTINSAAIRTSGIDFSLNTENIKGSLNWTSNFFLSYTKNRVLENDRAPLNIGNYANIGATLIPPALDYPLNGVYSYRSAGLNPENGNPRGYRDGELSEDYTYLTRNAPLDDLVFNGSATPQVFGSLRNNLAYKNISLSVNLTYKFDYVFRRNTIWYSRLLNVNNMVIGHADYEKRWQVPGDELMTQVPALQYPTNSNRDAFYAYSEHTIEKGDHIRLQDVNLSYTKRFEKGRRLPQSVTFTFYANNLGLLWKRNKAGLDPDFAERPLPRTYAIGINANF